MSRNLLAVAGVLAIVCASPAFADTQEVQDAVTPIVRVEPVILGHVQSTGTHSVSVATSSTETMTFEFDSRTVMPRELADGTPVRIDFRLMDNGDHFANRVTPILPGSKDWNALENARVSSDPIHDRELEAQRTAWNQTYPAEDARTNATNGTTDEPIAQNTTPDVTTQDNVLASPTTDSNNNDATDRLPQTASELPLLLAIGGLSLAGAVALAIRRRRHA